MNGFSIVVRLLVSISIERFCSGWNVLLIVTIVLAVLFKHLNLSILLTGAWELVEL